MGRVQTVIYSVTWFIVLLLFAWWVGLAASILHCLISPCAACCNCCKILMDGLAKGARIPYLISTFMVEGKSFKSAVITCYYNYYQFLYHTEDSYEQQC